MNTFKIHKFISTPLILISLLVSISGCSLFDSLFSTVTKLDFEKRPDYAVNRSLYLWKDIDRGEINLEVKFDKNNSGFNLALNKYFDKREDISNGIFDLVIRADRTEKISGKFYKNNQDYLIIDRNTFFENPTNNIPKDEWILFEDDEFIGSMFLDLMTHNLNKIDQEKIWLALKSGNLFTTTSSSTSEIYNEPVYEFDIDINKDEFQTIFEKITYALLSFMGKTNFDKEIYESVPEVLSKMNVIKGKIWINQNTFFVNRILIDMRNQEGTTISLEVNINPISPKEPNIKVIDPIPFSELEYQD